MHRAIDDAVAARMQWSRNLSGMLEQFYDLPGITEQNRQNRHDPQLAHNQRRFDMLGPIGPSCSRLESLGGDEHDVYRACGVSSIPAPCKVISIGSMDKWDFEESVFNRTACHTHTFDCTVTDKAKPPAYIRARAQIHRTCMGARSYLTAREKRPMFGNAGTQTFGKRVRAYHDWPRMLKSTLKFPSGAPKVPALLKLDIEGGEWDVLREMVEQTELLPDQISMELHYGTSNDELSWYGRFKSAGEIALWMDRMWRLGRYMLVDRSDGVCAHCTQLLLVTEGALRRLPQPPPPPPPPSPPLPQSGSSSSSKNVQTATQPDSSGGGGGNGDTIKTLLILAIASALTLSGAIVYASRRKRITKSVTKENELGMSPAPGSMTNTVLYS